MKQLMIPALLGCTVAGHSNDRPNILWLTIEDTSSYEFGCYGNSDVRTPNVDSLAAEGIRYSHVWSVAPQSSPARSTIITGRYATTFAMDFHRNRQATSADIFFPQLLREAGYYCTNNSKTDYNTSNDHRSCWDECDRWATYNSPNRTPGQPFFAVFNCMATHMGRIRSFHLQDRRDFALEGLDPQRLTLPPHLPDLKEIRSDYACHLEGVQDIDRWVGFFLSDLKKKGLDENTILFFFSDHGGCSPRGKGYLNETGLRVPLVVYLPAKWQHLSSGGVGRSEGRLVSFTDLAPTVLSLAGVKIPEERFHGTAFLGREAAQAPRYQFAFTSNQHHNFMPVRAATDGRYKYIRNYIPYKHASLRNYYQWGMPANMAWDSLVLNRKTLDPILLQPFVHRRGEMLFDLENDPFEINDLSQKPEYKTKLTELRVALSNHIRHTSDLGFISPSMRSDRVVLFDKVRSSQYDLSSLHSLVERASTPHANDVSFFASYLNHKEVDFRFWAAVGLAELASSGVTYCAPKELLAIVDDPDDYVAAEGCYALVYLNVNREKALKRLVTPHREEYRKAGYSLLECLALDEKIRPLLTPCLPQLQQSAQTIQIKDNEDPGLISRGILVNLGQLTLPEVYGEEGHAIGLKINRGRRPLLPLPVPDKKRTTK